MPLRSFSVRRAGVVDYLSDLHEVDRGFDAVQTGHPLAQLLREEALGSVRRFPDIEIHRAPPRVVDGEDLRPQPRHALKRLAGVPRNGDHAGAIEVLVVLEADAHADHCGSSPALPIASGCTRCGIPLHLRRSTSAMRMPLASSRSRVLRL